MEYLQTQTQDAGRLKWLQRKLAGKRLDLLKLTAPELAPMRDAQMAARGVDLDTWREQVLPTIATKPKTYFQRKAEAEQDAARLRTAKQLAARADRATVRLLSANEKWRIEKYTDSREAMIAAMPEFRTWAAEYYGPEWVLKSPVDLLGAFQVFQLSGRETPVPDVSVSSSWLPPIDMGDYAL